MSISQSEGQADHQARARMQLLADELEKLEAWQDRLDAASDLETLQLITEGAQKAQQTIGRCRQELKSLDAAVEGNLLVGQMLLKLWVGRLAAGHATYVSPFEECRGLAFALLLVDWYAIVDCAHAVASKRTAVNDEFTQDCSRQFDQLVLTTQFLKERWEANGTPLPVDGDMALGEFHDLLSGIGQTCPDPRIRMTLIGELVRDPGLLTRANAAHPSGRPAAAAVPRGRPSTTAASPMPTAAVILGMLGIWPCGLWTALPAWIVGARELRRIDAGVSPAAGRGRARIGMALGIIGSILSFLSLLLSLIRQ